MRILLITIPIAITGIIAIVMAGSDHIPVKTDEVGNNITNYKPETAPPAPVIKEAAQAEIASPEQQEANEPITSITPNNYAVQSLREAMHNGDPRTPPLAANPYQRVKPTASELADPDLYMEYEVRQEKAVYASFAAASKIKIAELEELIALGKQHGISQEQLNEATRKLEGLRNQREIILKENPDIDTGDQ